ncbi:hypothetical protein J7J47_09600 [Halomonas sp. ISL-60]|uniref:hypothetical protein n=1 Tax=unclassified Halomonas TaxID=2609666 RepID=UPI0007DA2420|nr:MULTISPECIES: hypothetical protein [unclassified Halomonas]MBT2772487.1 hypothetical protein [Halomonas sp. ISL-60]MBT2788574.1 hypothetical protein [Halomonas sp. ISL-106]MBT2798165.1 hypothetical protein [Halomonas sp. ISL-104]MBT2802689.1 hypothetical protein [Halomonas sp. ISL-56]OAL60717.1 hypothetical protein A6R74_18560 [Halomonas sp. ALS9]
MWKKLGIALIASWLPINGFAAEPVEQRSPNHGGAERAAPEIAGTLDDELHEWFILSHGNDSNASFVELGNDISIDITGSVDDEAWEGEESLSISLTVNEEQLINAVVIYSIGSSISPPLFTSEGGEVVITLTRYERSSQIVHVAGKITGILALQIELGEPPSLDEGIEIDVAFDVEAQKIEF